MLNTKVPLTKPLISFIQSGRHAKGTSAADISILIGKTISYVSGMENARIKKISSEDLIKITSFLYDLSEEDAIKKIEAILSATQELDVTSAEDLTLDEGEVSNKDVEIRKYTFSGEISKEDDYKKLLHIISQAFLLFFEKEPDDAERILKRFINSLRFDLGFAMAMLSLPYSALRPLSHEERQEAFDDISDAFRKHFIRAKAKQEPADE